MFRSRRRSYHLMRTALLGAGIAITLAFHATPAQPRRAMPTSLSDREFWQLFTTMSEESGTFPSENFVSNEKTYQHVIPTLQKTLTPNGVYLGVGPEQNFTYIANLKPRLAVIFDIRRENAMMHLMYKALFELSPTRAAFLSRLFSRPLPLSLAPSAPPAELFAASAAAPVSDSAFDANWKAIVDRLTVTHRFALPPADIAAIRHIFTVFREAGPEISYAYHLGAPPSATQWLVTYAQLQSLTNVDGENMAFLATEESYRWLREFQTKNLVVPLVGDFAGPKAIREVGRYVAERGGVVTAFYVSNVEQYLFGGLGADQRFYRNVEALPIDSTSTFIRSLPGGVSAPGLQVLLSTPATYRITVTDTGGVRTYMATRLDSVGKLETTRVSTPLPTAASSTLPPPNTIAFLSGIATIDGTLAAFSTGRLKTYAQVSALTKTDGWSQPPR